MSISRSHAKSEIEAHSQFIGTLAKPVSPFWIENAPRTHCNSDAEEGDGPRREKARPGDDLRCLLHRQNYADWLL
jgi:hypothetical protein